MTKQPIENHVAEKGSHSKSSKAGLEILTEELELALKWGRPSILFAVHDSQKGRTDTQRSLEKEIINKGARVEQLQIDSESPDVIRVMEEMPNSKGVVFYVSGIENADQGSDGKVYRALNIRRELLVEKCICVVFWVNELEMASLPRFAPDFWAFRHRVVEFAPKRGSKKQSIPAGLFLWEKQIAWMEMNVIKDKIAYYKEALSQLPMEAGAAASQIEIVLQLIQLNWLANDLLSFSKYLKVGISLLEKYPIPRYQAWLLNADGIELFEEGKKEDANTKFTRALSYDPDNSAILMNLGITAHGMGKNGKSLHTGEQAIKKDPDNFHLLYSMGYLLLSMGKLEASTKAISKAMEINPSDKDIHYLLATCYLKSERHAECKEELSAAETVLSPQNAIDHARISFLSNRTDETFGQLKHSIQKGEISKHHIQRDPILSFFINPKELSFLSN